ncbi:hypothetical protein Bhyg_08824 [Pseudolycoriella hygida]|uniref:Uncharacterized protein n=1 Tax=Pseudolycoriella hygida TaxID=35572 RepID=A0A9Q0S3X3_9DIPT|nr:hypothetical protein Bhyg_08824 [Pseudolycoriella hygida]
MLNHCLWPAMNLNLSRHFANLPKYPLDRLLPLLSKTLWKIQIKSP